MINASQPILVIYIRKLFMITFQIIIVFVDPTYPANGQLLITLFDFDHAASTEVIYVFSDPAAIIQISEKVWSLMIPTNKKSQYRCSLLLSKIPMKLSHALIFGWAFKCVQILLCSQALYSVKTFVSYLEISRTHNKINFFGVLLLPLPEFFIKKL